MIKIYGQPVIGDMAGFAHIAGRQMITRFSGGNVSIVTAGTNVVGLTVIDGLKQRIPASAGDMTAVTHIGAQHMITGFARSDAAVMAEDALLTGLAVIEWQDNRQPLRGAMAGFAQVAGQWVVTRFKGKGTGTVVSTGAGTGLPRHCGMVKRCRSPRGN